MYILHFYDESLLSLPFFSAACLPSEWTVSSSHTVCTALWGSHSDWCNSEQAHLQVNYNKRIPELPLLAVVYRSWS